MTLIKRAADTAVGSANESYPWNPTPAVRISMLLHAAAVATVVMQPALWPWALGAVAGNHLLLTVAVFWPRGRVLGANLFRLKREVESAQTIIAEITGRAPRFFRAPMGLRSPLLDPVLARYGLRYVSWTRRSLDAIHRDPAIVLQRLAGGLAAGDILLLHDNGFSRTKDGEPVVLAVLPGLLEIIKARGLRPVTLSAALDDESTG